MVGLDILFGRPMENGDKGRFLLQRKQKGTPTIVVRFGNLSILEKICLLAPISLRNKLGQMVIACYFCKAIIESTYHVAFNY